MKRKTRESNEEKKSHNETAVAKENEVIKLIKGLQNKVKEQDKKINQLFKANKEFKNSVMALYLELEKAKDKERQVEKIFGDNQNNTKIELSSADNKISMDYKDFMKIFTNAAENFSKGTPGQPINQNLFYINNNNDISGYNRGYNNSNKVVQFSIDDNKSMQNQMIENGSVGSSKNPYQAAIEENKEDMTIKPDPKVLMSPTNSYDDM